VNKLVQDLSQQADGKLVSLINLESTKTKNALVIPFNYVSDPFNSQMEKQNPTKVKFYDSIERDININIGNSRNIFGQSNNGDIDDYYSSLNYLSLSFYMKPNRFYKNNGKNLETLFLNQKEYLSLFETNSEVMDYLIEKASIQLDIEQMGGEFLCLSFNDSNPAQCNDFPSTPYNLYVAVKIDITNRGQKDI